MPVYEYRCEANGRVVEVLHDSDVTVSNWGELCFAAGITFGDTDPTAPVKRIIRSAPGAAVPDSDSELRAAGFTKLVKRDEGVYENVTAIEGEARYMRRGQKETIPHLHKKIED